VNSSAESGHDGRIRAEFTERAEAFATAPGITDGQALKVLLEISEAGGEDTVLDVACGAGVVVCAFAALVKRATGIDITPAMIDRARCLQEEKRCRNVAWEVGDSRCLPYADGAFSIVVTRYSFHHIEQPELTLREMARVCAPSGKVIVADVCASSDAGRAATFNAMERLRDPSHVRTLAEVELTGLFANVGLQNMCSARYFLEFSLRDLVQHSSAAAADIARVEQMVRAQVGVREPAFPVRQVNGELVVVYPILVLAGTKAA